MTVNLMTTSFISGAPQFITMSEARGLLSQAIVEATTFERGSMHPSDDKDTWYIAFNISVAKRQTRLGKWLSSINFPFSRKRVDFIVRADVMPNFRADGTRGKAHRFSLFNAGMLEGGEMTMFKPFRDAALCNDCGVFMTVDFNAILAVVRSELTGEPVPPQYIR